MLNKRTAKLFIENNTDKDNTYQVLDSVKFSNNEELLLACQDMYDRLRTTRGKMIRSINYLLGRQWEDRILDPDGLYTNQTIKEEDYIRRQGKVPLKYNIMNKSKKSIVGLYRQNKGEPVAIAHDRDEQKLGEMMTIAMQYVCDINKVPELNARLLESAFCTGLFVRSCYFRHNSERQMSDVDIQNENPFMIFFNSDVQDHLMRDITTVGAIRDLSMNELVSAFAKTEAEAKALVDEYRDVLNQKVTFLDAFDKNRHGTESDFLVTKDKTKCRVIEVWNKESERCYYVHDRAKGTEYYAPLTDKASFLAENERRKAEMVSLGYSEDNASLIEFEWFVRKFWYFRYLTPTGRCISEGESPFEHGSHPFTIGAYPLLNGEIYSPAEELIDIQRGINRRLSQIDFLIQNSAKGVLMCPVDAVPDDMSYKQFAQEYTRNGGVLFYKAKAGIDMPKQITSASVSAGELEVVKLYMQLNDEISGINGALQGQKPTSNTPAARYAQEAQNSSINIEDFIGWFNSCVRDSNYKMMQVMQQFYDDKRYIPIVGKTFSEESKWYDPVRIKGSKFDLRISEATSTPAYRMALEDTLFKAFETQAIDFKTYLEASSAPFADQLLEIIKRKEADAAKNGTPINLGGVAAEAGL